MEAQARTLTAANVHHRTEAFRKIMTETLELLKYYYDTKNDVLIAVAAAPGDTFDPPNGLTDSSGQVTTNVSLGGMAGRYRITAFTFDKSHKRVELKLDETALGYQQTLGRRLNDQYCDRCHNPESSVERVSNYDNLEVKPHPFTEGDALNKMSDADLTAIITNGGPALQKSALMPAWGNTLSKSDIQALIAYIRAVSDPPSRNGGPIYAERLRPE
jgi:mono/diheme cytochrome c family protein